MVGHMVTLVLCLYALVCICYNASWMSVLACCKHNGCLGKEPRKPIVPFTRSCLRWCTAKKKLFCDTKVSISSPCQQVHVCWFEMQYHSDISVVPRPSHVFQHTRENWEGLIDFSMCNDHVSATVFCHN